MTLQSLRRRTGLAALVSALALTAACGDAPTATSGSGGGGSTPSEGATGEVSAATATRCWCPRR